MNLAELKLLVDSAYFDCKEPDKVSVVVTTADMSVGPRASTRVIGACMGFDWETNQFRIDTEEQIIRKKDSKR